MAPFFFEFPFLKSEAVAEFLIEIIEVCQKHGFVLEHEDIGGGFIVRNYDQPRLRIGCVPFLMKQI